MRCNDDTLKRDPRVEARRGEIPRTVNSQPSEVQGEETRGGQKGGKDASDRGELGDPCQVQRREC